jgi:hypothetical protein
MCRILSALFEQSRVDRRSAGSQHDEQRDGTGARVGVKVVPTATSADCQFDFEFDINGDGVVSFAGMGTHSADGGGARCSVVPDPGRERPDKGGPRNPEVVTLGAPAVPIIVLDHGIPSRVAIKVIKGTASTYKVTERLAAAGGSVCEG